MPPFARSVHTLRAAYRRSNEARCPGPSASGYPGARPSTGDGSLWRRVADIRFRSDSGSTSSCCYEIRTIDSWLVEGLPEQPY